MRTLAWLIQKFNHFYKIRNQIEFPNKQKFHHCKFLKTTTVTLILLFHIHHHHHGYKDWKQKPLMTWVVNYYNNNNNNYYYYNNLPIGKPLNKFQMYLITFEE
jgi:hypothetical protein